MDRRLPLMITAVLLAAAGVGSVRVHDDPARYGTTFFLLMDGDTYSEAMAVDQVQDELRRSLGPYRGPVFALTDLAGTFDLIGPTGRHRRAVLTDVTAPRGEDFAAEAHATLHLEVRSAGWFLTEESGEISVRCRSMDVRYDHGALDISTHRIPCPSA